MKKINILIFFIWIILGLSYTSKADQIELKALNAFSKSYFPGRSGQIMFVPKKYNTFLKGWKRFEHGSPWDYDAHVPLLFYGPRYIKSGVFSNAVDLSDIVPTQAKLLKISPPPTASGKAILQVLKDIPLRPKVIVTMVIDGISYPFIKKHLDKLPNLSVLKLKSAWLTNARLCFLPTATAVSHAVIGTGAYPSLTGIVANKIYSKKTGKMEVPWLEGGMITPKNLACGTLADYWDLLMNNKPIIAGVCWIARATGGMKGHGAYITNADKDIFIAYNKNNGQLISNPNYYSLPVYLKEFNIKDYWESIEGIFLGHKINNYSIVRFSPVMPKFIGDIFLKILSEEPIGADDITDLLYLNLKAADMTGHKYGQESKETHEVLLTIDKYIGKIVSSLENKVGKNNFVFILTADHGMVPSLEVTGGERIYWKELAKKLQDTFDHNEDTKKVFLGYSGYNIYIDKEELAKNGYSLEDVKKYLMKEKRILVAFTEDEVIANIKR